MDDKKRKIILIVLGVLIILLIGVGITYAYFEARIDQGAQGDVNVTGDTTDNLIFDVSNDISLTINQFNFGSGAGNLASTATASASLRANSTNNAAKYNYYVYFQIKTNEYIYTTTDHKPEIVLTIIDPNGNPVTEIEGLSYVTATNADGLTLNGFDITSASGLFTIASNYEIISNSSKNATLQEWKITATFINLATDQENNTDKSMVGKVIIRRNPKVSTYDVSVNSNLTSSNLLASVSCNNGSGTFDNYNKKLISSNFVNNTICNITASPETKTNFNTYLINQVGTNGLVNHTFTYSGTTYNSGYRYQGTNPQNYVWFNDELWRIIGVFSNSSHGISGSNLVKIVRVMPLSLVMWNSVENNNWATSSSKTLLNNYYYNSLDASSTDYCVYKSGDTYYWPSADCDYTGIGIKSKYRSMIQQTTWYLGTRPFGDSNHATADSFYYYERRSDYISGSASTTAYIGLPYVSDYAFALGSFPSGGYIQSSILNSSWLYDTGGVWTLASSTYPSSTVTLISNGDIYGGYPVENNDIKPTLYLKSNVFVVSGDGSKANPYIIGI